MKTDELLTWLPGEEEQCRGLGQVPGRGTLPRITVSPLGLQELRVGELCTVRFVPWFREEMSEASDEKVGRIPRGALERPVVKRTRKFL